MTEALLLEKLERLARDHGWPMPDDPANQTPHDCDDLLKQNLESLFQREAYFTGPMDDAMFLTEVSVPLDDVPGSNNLFSSDRPRVMVRISFYGSLAMIYEEDRLPGNVHLKAKDAIVQSGLCLVPEILARSPSTCGGPTWFDLFFQYA